MKRLWATIPGLMAGFLATGQAAGSTDITVVATPNPIDIPEVLIVIALLAIAIWQKGWVRMMLSVGIVIWGVFFISYDVKIAGPLLGVGLVLFVQAILAKIQQSREAYD